MCQKMLVNMFLKTKYRIMQEKQLNNKTNNNNNNNTHLKQNFAKNKSFNDEKIQYNEIKENQ